MTTISRSTRLLVLGILLVTACSGGAGSGEADSADLDGATAEARDGGSDGSAEAPDDEAPGDDSADEPGDEPAATRPVSSTIDYGPFATEIPAPTPLSSVDAAGGDGEDVVAADQTLPPIDLLEVVELGVAAGSFSEAEGIARALDGMSGRAIPTPGLGPDDVIEPGLTGLSRRAADLVASGELGDEDRALLEAALVPYAPTQELLDSISAPAPGPTAGFASVSVSSSAMSTARVEASGGPSGPIEIIRGDCFDVIATGVSTDTDLDTGDVCYYYLEADVAGNRMRVYYPSPWQTESDQLALADAALAAMIDSADVYDDLATVGDINAVFSLTDSGTTLAQQLYFDLDTPCPITMFTTASAGSVDVFKQTVAHEVFHCVQDWSFTSAPYDTHQWWLEGSAEYFSNVVYPATNDEHDRTGVWDARSLDRDITQLSYDNTVFFQYYSNLRGDAATIDLLETVSSGGATIESIASIDDMEKIWRDFVVAMMADAVADTGGGTVGEASRLKSVIVVDSEDEFALETAPMVAARYAVRYAKGHRFVQLVEGSAHVASAYVADYRDLDAWTEMPTEVRTTCERTRTYVVVVTTAAEPIDPTIDVNTMEKAVCDPCLLGTWGLRLPTFAAYIQAVVATAGADVPAFDLTIEGRYTFVFEVDGSLSSGRDLAVIASIPGVGSGPTTSITGTESGRYDADGRKLTVTGWRSETTASLGVASSSVFTGPEAESTDYTCEDNVLTMTSLPYGELVFDLLEPPAEPAPIIIETGV